MSDERFIRKALSGKLTPAQRYALVMLMEECAEVSVFCSKALRWGFQSRNPFNQQDGTNIEQIRREVCDVIEAIERLERSVAKKRAAPPTEKAR